MPNSQYIEDIASLPNFADEESQHKHPKQQGFGH